MSADTFPVPTKQDVSSSGDDKAVAPFPSQGPLRLEIPITTSASASTSSSLQSSPTGILIIDSKIPTAGSPPQHPTSAASDVTIPAAAAATAANGASSMSLPIPLRNSSSSSSSDSDASTQSQPALLLHSSSASSSSSPSPTDGPNTANTTATSTPLNVKFAPLPQLAPRKRRSAVPLGMAARTQLLHRRRRHHHQQYYDPDSGPQYGQGAWTEEELAEARMRQVQAAMERERQRRQQEQDAADMDPFMVFGRIVKDAGKQLWSKLSKKESKAKLKPKNGEEEQPSEGVPVEEQQSQERTALATEEKEGLEDASEKKEGRPKKGDDEEDDEDDVPPARRSWEHDMVDGIITQEILRRIGQTDTVLDDKGVPFVKPSSRTSSSSNSIHREEVDDPPKDKDLPPVPPLPEPSSTSSNPPRESTELAYAS